MKIPGTYRKYSVLEDIGSDAFETDGSKSIRPSLGSSDSSVNEKSRVDSTPSENIAQGLINRMKVLPPVTTFEAATQIKSSANVATKRVTTMAACTTTMKRVTIPPRHDDFYDEADDSSKSAALLTPHRGDSIKPFHVDTYTTINDVRSPGVSWITTKYDIDYKKAKLLEQRTWSVNKPDGKIMEYTDKMFESQEKYNKKLHVYREMTENVHDSATGSTHTKFYRFIDQEVDSSEEYDEDGNTIQDESMDKDDGHWSLPGIDEEEIDDKLERQLDSTISSMEEEIIR